MRNKLTKALCIIAVSSPVHANYVGVVGDVVGRDLAYPGAGWAGHTGVATAPHYLMRPTLVLQAMSNAPHIQEVSIDNFKSQSTYWGSRGGRIPFDYKFGRWIVANRVVQQYYACPAYSYTWQWKDGTITADNKPVTCALFRCDTIVNWAYAFGNYSLPTYNTVWTTPAGVYNSFPLNTDLLIPERYKDHPVMQVTTNDTVDWVSESNLKELNADLFYQLLQNTPDITRDQINRLWKLFASNEVGDQVKVLFYNYMVAQDMSHLTDDIIQRAKTEHGVARHQLLLMLQTIYQGKWNDKNASETQSIINYFKELQHEELDKEDAGIIFRAMATLAPQDMRKDNLNLIHIDKIHVDIFRLKSDPENELSYVKDIIANLDDPNDSLLRTASYKYLTELLINSDLKLFSDAGKELFRTYLGQKKMMDHTQSMLYTSAYVEFKAALNAKSLNDIPELATSYMKSLDEDTRQVTPYGFSDFTKNKLNFMSEL